MPFPLLLVIVFIVFSWLSIYLLEKRNIFRSWFTPADLRVKEFMLGCFVMGMLCIISQLLLSQLSGISWTLSEEITFGAFLQAIAFDVNSVLFEELLFRGVLLYALIKYATPQKGIIFSASAFGLWHWFSYGVIGNILGMALVFLSTGFMGYVFAKAYVKTQSIILPFGLHIGWNWIHNSVFSNGPNGKVLLVPDQTVALEGYYGLISFLWYMVIPGAALLFLKSGIFNRLRSSANPSP